MKKQILLSVILVVLSAGNLLAHALWIETNPTGKSGQAQDVKIFYGEYADNERDSVDKWYSDIKQITVWLITPDNQNTQLVLTGKADYLLTSFTPLKDGVYTINVSHDAKDFPGTTRYQFNASALITVGKPNAIKDLLLDTAIGIYANETGNLDKSFIIKAFLNNKPGSKITVAIASPEGWTKNFKTDENGILDFTPIWAGRYMIEIMNTEKIAGEHNGKNYKSIWRNATQSIVVTK